MALAKLGSTNKDIELTGALSNSSFIGVGIIFKSERTIQIGSELNAKSAISGYGELTKDELDIKITNYEKKYDITSEALLRMENEGSVPDKLEYHAWLSWLHARGY